MSAVIANEDGANEDGANENGGREASGTAKRAAFSWLDLLRIVVLLWACVCVEQDIEGLMSNADATPGLGRISMIARWTPSSPPGFATVNDVRPGGPAALAGIQAGDYVRFDRSFDYARHLWAGERIGVTIDHGGQHRHAVLVPVPVPQGGGVWDFVANDGGNALACLIMALFGGFFVWRGRGKATTLLLGAALTGYGLSSALPQFWLSGPQIFMYAFIAGALNYGLIPILFWAFALSFYRDTIAAPKRWEYVVFALYAGVQLATNTALSWFLLTLQPLPIIGSAFDASTWVSYIGYIAAFAYVLSGWRRSRRDVQQRYALMLVATAAIVLAQAAVGAVAFMTVLPDAFKTPLAILTSLLSGVVAPPLFAYAILRHKVLDLGFAINRTLVYGVVSAVLLVAFGVAEWAFEHFIPLESREASVFVDAGIALAVFLVFHRVRDFVEHNIEKLFFHKWHQKEARLKRFVHEATFILKRDPMVAAYVAALREFCDGADVALYLADETGTFRLAGGGLAGQPVILDADNSFMVTLRADRTVFEPDTNKGATAIALALPMIHRTEVIGATLLGAKPSGFAYRPDEKEVLAYAAHQIGLDLHALEVERLQQANASLLAVNDTLTAKYKDLRDMTVGLLTGTGGVPVAPDTV